MKLEKFGSIIFVGGPQDGKRVDGLHNPVVIPEYKFTGTKKDGCWVFQYDKEKCKSSTI